MLNISAAASRLKSHLGVAQDTNSDKDIDASENNPKPILNNMPSNEANLSSICCKCGQVLQVAISAKNASLNKVANSTTPTFAVEYSNLVTILISD